MIIDFDAYSENEVRLNGSISACPNSYIISSTLILIAIITAVHALKSLATITHHQ